MRGWFQTFDLVLYDQRRSKYQRLHGCRRGLPGAFSEYHPGVLISVRVGHARRRWSRLSGPIYLLPSPFDDRRCPFLTNGQLFSHTILLLLVCLNLCIHHKSKICPASSVTSWLSFKPVFCSDIASWWSSLATILVVFPWSLRLCGAFALPLSPAPQLDSN